MVGRAPACIDRARKMLPIGAVGIFAAAEIDAIAEAERFRDRQRTVQFEPIAAEAVAIEQERLPCFIRRAPEREIDNPARRGERIALRRQRSEERRGGEGVVSTDRSRWGPDN